MKKLLISLLILGISVPLLSQDFKVPENYQLETNEDYAKYEQDVISGVNWLVNNPLGQEPSKRKEVNAFLLKWLTGSPNVSVEISPGVVTFMDCAECLMIFMGGWTKYALEKKDYTNKEAGNVAGIEKVIEFYSKNKVALGKNKAIEKYIKLKVKGKLEKYIANNI